MRVLITGSSGQFGQALKSIAGNYNDIEFYYTDTEEGDITNKDTLAHLFAAVKPDFCINAAAYTAVDKAESEKELSELINVTGAANLAEVCKEHKTTLLHISTDFVFDGSKNTPYTEEDETNPQSVYGLTKRDGEKKIQEILEEHYIVRTSWLYSQFANNFMKTMLRVAKERPSLSVVDDQTGTPTHAVDLAKALLSIIETNNKKYGIYHFSNEGQTTWYGFAKKIFEVNGVSVDLQSIPTSAYPTPAARPSYSVLDKSKIKEVFGLEIREWQAAIEKLNSND